MQELQKEHEELQCSLRVSDSSARRVQDTEATQSLRSSLERRDEVEEQLEQEKQAIAQLDQEVGQHTATHGASHNLTSFTKTRLCHKRTAWLKKEFE